MTITVSLVLAVAALLLAVSALAGWPVADARVLAVGVLLLAVAVIVR